MKLRLLAIAILLASTPASACLWPWSPAKLGTCVVASAESYEWESSLGQSYASSEPKVTVQCDATSAQSLKVRARFGAWTGPWSAPSQTFTCSGMIAGETLLPYTWSQWITAFERGDIVCEQRIEVPCP